MRSRLATFTCSLTLVRTVSQLQGSNPGQMCETLSKITDIREYVYKRLWFKSVTLFYTMEAYDVRSKKCAGKDDFHIGSHTSGQFT